MAFLNKVMGSFSGKIRAAFRLAPEDRSVRVTDLFPSNNAQRINKTPIIILVLFFIIVFPVMVYFLVGFIKFQDSRINSENIGIHNMYAKHKIDKNNVIIEGKLILQISFLVKGQVKVYPSGTYTVSTRIVKNQTVSITSTSNFPYSTSQQLIEVAFKLEATHLQDEQIRVFRERLANKKVFIEIRADFNFKIDLGGLLVFPNSNKHVYLTCAIPYKVDPSYGKDFDNCKISSDQ